MIVDMHCDTISRLQGQSGSNLRTSDNMVNLLKLKKSDYLMQCFAMFVRLKEGSEKYYPFAECHKLIDRKSVV